MSSHYEIEIKSLLGSKENAEKLRANLKKHDRTMRLTSSHSELNHYFNEPADRQRFYAAVESLISKKEKASLKKLLADAKTLSIRTRQAEGKVLLVVKASIDDATSANGVSRIEFEGIIGKTLDELDKLLLSAGLSYQAKWSRDREEYKSGDTNICIDRNAGYGYLAEFEQVVVDEEKADDAKKELVGLMEKLGVEELPQDRLERMFAHYNTHWSEYYGTDKIFVIE